MTVQQRDTALLFAIGLAVRVLAMLPVAHPGYMDAAYSYDVALNLAHGGGLNEPFLWNYLDLPAGIPHPSHLYWMPLPTLLAWLGIALFGQSYRAAQIPFIVLSALLPVISYWVARQATRRRFYGWVAGLLTVFSGFYVVYWGHADNFAPFALAGSLCLIAGWKGLSLLALPKGLQSSGAAANGRPLRVANPQGPRAFYWTLAAGVLAGLAHLSRADGALLLAVVALFLALRLRRATRMALIGLAGLGVGYLAVMLPWFVRSWVVAGTPLTTVGAQTMWLTSYDDLFSYGRELSLSTYLAWGWDNILRSKLQALWLNAQTAVAVLGMVFLAPLAWIGGWRLRGNVFSRLVGSYGALLFLAMTCVFTFPGPRGGLFHSGGALLPFIYAASLAGLDTVVEWASARRRTWNPAMARQVFAAGLVGLAVLVSGLVYYPGVVASTRWRQPDAAYTRLAGWLAAQGEPDAIVMVNDPPGYWYAANMRSIVAPSEPPEATLAAADRYGARYLVLDANRPAPLAALYVGEATHPRLQAVYTFPDEAGRPVVVFRVVR